jgi:hypothetical protein
MANEKRLIDANTKIIDKYFNKRLIDANDLWPDIMMLPHNGDMISSEEVIQTIKSAPTVDAVEVVHGHWEYGKWEQGHWVKGNERCRCSVCHRDFTVDNLNIWHGCPQCLAKMDGDGNG